MNEQYQMAYISYNKLWESEFDNIVSKKDKRQDLNNNQLKLEVQESYGKHKKSNKPLNLLMIKML